MHGSWPVLDMQHRLTDSRAALVVEMAGRVLSKKDIFSLDSDE